MPSPVPEFDRAPTPRRPSSLRSSRGLVERPDIAPEQPNSHAHVLQVVQPGLLGLMDGSVSTLAPLFATAMMFSEDLDRTMNFALHYAVICAEDAARVKPDEVASLGARLRAPSLAQRNLTACEGWPRPPLPEDFASSVVSDKPVLLLSGGLDPVTPPANAEIVARTLSNHRHVVAAGYGHIVSPHACAPRLIESFIDEAGFATLPQSCLDYFVASKRPPLFATILESR